MTTNQILRRNPSSSFELYRRHRLDATDAPPGGYLSIWRGYTLDCYPPEATLNDGYVYLSPGICPSAYSIAIQYTNPNPVGPTTVATCCPWFMHASASHYDCASYPESTSVELVENGTTITTSGYAWETPLVIAWQETDLSLFPHHPTATGSWNIAKGIASPVSPTTVPPITVTSGGMFISAQPSDGGVVSSKNLSTGAQAGIGVGVSLFVILAVAVGVLVLLRRRRMRKLPAPSGEGVDIDIESPDTVKGAAQLAGDAIYEKAATEGVLEAGGQPLGHELTGSQADGTLYRVELEGSSRPELEGDSGYLLGIGGRGELEADLKTSILEDVGRRELEGDLKAPPDYESSRDYSRDVAKVDQPYTPDIRETNDEKTKEDMNAKE